MTPQNFLGLDSTDMRLLDALQSDGRITNQDLAEKVNLSPSACLRRVRRLEDSGVINGYVALLNPAKVGRSSNIFIEITLSSQSEAVLDAFELAIAKIPDVMECYLMAGEADYLVRVAVSSAEDYERIHKSYFSRLPGVARIRSIFAMRTVCKKRGFVLETEPKTISV
ncbi:Lrp/AsnC family transcriptional regulator [Magnetovibrio sp.]|uniref:Lrp/AsnC family transcriptional regulator n=1 Tax=Magnetovibrio sp. TaxID=2024836 RepID=UPI002F92B456